MAVENIEIDVSKDQEGQRLDHFLARTFPQVSRAYLQKRIVEEKILLNEKRTRKGDLLKAGDRIQIIELLEIRERLPSPNPDLSIRIVYSDEVLAVIEKPAGIPTHPVHHEETKTVTNWWIAQHPEILQEAEDPLRVGIVHRLDTNTSGLLILARDPWTLENLQNQFRKREVRKEYLALTFGNPPHKGRIDSPLLHDPKSKKRMQIVRNPRTFQSDKARDALTEFTVEKVFEDFSLLRVRTHTGRMHQVRVHLASIGFPLVGDAVYGRRDQNQGLPFAIDRHFLHAAFLSFSHPKTKKPLEFQSLLPEELQQVLSHLLPQKT